ncbi:hypothetical protein GJ744_000663 [Endocarpon pusillum]|uniref:C2H2-type domain-containing protein n=1 Tax=Endocarpon pusillum TaxID=364733 RepID=A0A8H7AB58_9EURO|nr:hypothetical protein GJ744_000663 [Endocarpon pusillum]
MSYPGWQGYSGNYGSSSNDRSGAYGAGRASSAAAPVSKSPVYPVSTSQQQYASTAYAWPDRSQSSYGNINGNVQHYGNIEWRDGQGQRSVHEYPRPQTNHPVSPITSYNPHHWYGGNTQPQAQPSTQALSKLAYASGLNLQEQQPEDDRTAGHSHPGPQHLRAAPRETHGSERVNTPSYDRGHTSPISRIAQTSQSQQSPTSSHQDLAVSAAAALAGAVIRRYNSSPQQSSVSTQQYPSPTSAATNPGYQISANSVNNQHRQWMPSSQDTNVRSEPQAQTQPPPTVRAPSCHNLNRYGTTETHQYAHSSSSNVTLPLPSATRTLQPKPSYGPTQQHGQQNGVAGLPPKEPDGGGLDTTLSSRVDTFGATPQQQNAEQAASMPTFIDPSQVFNPYHKEHERQKREEEERAKRASIEALEPSVALNCPEAGTNPQDKGGPTTTASGSKQQALPPSTDAGGRQSSRSSSMTAESKDSVDVDMATEMKAMMHRLHEWKSKDPSLFQKLWHDMKKGGSSTQVTKGQTPIKSPQLAQVAPEQSSLTQSSQPLQSQASTAPQTQSQIQKAPLPSTSKTSSTPKRHWDPTMVVEDNEGGLPDLGRFPDERRDRRRNQEIAEAKARKVKAKQSAQAPSAIPTTSATQASSTIAHPDMTRASSTAPQPSATQTLSSVRPQSANETTSTVPPPSAAQAKQDDKLMWQTPPIPQPSTTTNAMSQTTSTQALPSINANGGTIWPEVKRKALAEAAQKALMGLPANKGKSITAAEIHALVEQNPSYIELCTELEARGFAFHRGQFARFILNNVPELSLPSQPRPKIPPQPARAGPSPIPPPQQAVPNGKAASPAAGNGSLQQSHPPAHSSAYINYRLMPAPPSKPTPNRLTKPRLGVPSPRIPTPVPGSKEAKARKRDFSELVDLTQLSDDEDYSMPRKQARHEESPEKDVFQVQTDIAMPNAAMQMSSMQRQSSGPSFQSSYRPSGGAAPLKFAPQAQTMAPRLQSQARAPSPQAVPQKSRHLLAKPLNKTEALRKSYYDPKTVARDILIAAGRHPGEYPLNAHFARLLGKHIDIDSDLSTFDWDSVDPGGPPMPVVQVVDIPAGPPRWKVGQRAKARGPTPGTVDTPPRVRTDDKAKSGEQRATTRNGTAVRVGHVSKESGKESGKEKPDQGHVPGAGSPLARPSTQGKSLVEDPVKPLKSPPKSTPQPARARPSQNINAESKTPPAKKALAKTPPRPSRNIDAASKTPPAKKALAKTPPRPSQNIDAASKTPPTKKALAKTPPRPSQNIDTESKTPPAKKAPAKSPPRPASHQETTPHRPHRPHSTPSITPTIFTSPASQNSIKRGRGRPRKSSITMSAPSSEPSSEPAKRRGRPPGSKNRATSAYMLKKAAKSSGLHVAVPTPRRSTSPPQYNIYACQWRKCDVKLHNLSTLRKHIARVHKVPDDEAKGEGQPCWWKNCRTLRVNGAEISPEVTFNSTSDWLDHVESDHLHPIGMKLGDGPSSTQTDPQTLARNRQIYLSDEHGRAVTAPSTKTTILDYPSDTLVLSSVTMNPESNIPNRAFSKAHGNEKMEPRQSAIETLLALQRHKERVGPGLDRGGCTLVNEERRKTLMDTEGMMREVPADY